MIDDCYLFAAAAAAFSSLTAMRFWPYFAMLDAVPRSWTASARFWTVCTPIVLATGCGSARGATLLPRGGWCFLSIAAAAAPRFFRPSSGDLCDLEPFRLVDGDLMRLDARQAPAA